jgi:bifunctional non-homologous end joining protein LigD
LRHGLRIASLDACVMATEQKRKPMKARAERTPGTGENRPLTPARSRIAKPVDQRLEDYRAKRHFGVTPEPKGAKSTAREEVLSFVVQKHAARQLHYDFRLELDGVLLSWSVPKGPSLRPGDRRLAVRTEDHPIEYADFEGIIPKGEYGGGTVVVWDRGTWTPDGDPRVGMRKGKLTFTLHGEKLRGRFHLARTKLDSGKRENWLLFKGNDDSARVDSDIVSERPESALSGRTVEEVAATPERVWHSNLPASEQTPAAASRSAAKTPDLTSLVKRLPLDFGLTNLEKVLYAEQNIRKAELIAYFASVASRMLPHVAERPLTLVRCPHGTGHKCFFQKHAYAGVPPVIVRVPIREEEHVEEYMAVRDLEGLVALAQLGALEVHTWVCHTTHVEQPDQFVFDIDPDETLHWDRVVEAALATKRQLEEYGLESFVKTTGGKGLHVVVPVEPGLSWEQHKDFARAIAEGIAREHPQQYLTNMRKALRKGKIFLDYFRNGRGATAIAPYSTRARPGAPVATPLTWDELESGVDPKSFTLFTVIKRLDSLERDPWRGYAGNNQRVDAAALRALHIR